MWLQAVACGPERADEVHRLTQAAFRAHGKSWNDPLKGRQ